MSRQNKVNPGMYTQRGRLAQDDIARELARQRAIEPTTPWPREQRPPFQSREALKDGDETDDQQSPEPAEPVKKKPARVKAKTARKTARTTTAKAVGKAKTVKAKTVKAKGVKRAQGRDTKRQTGRRGRAGIE